MHNFVAVQHQLGRSPPTFSFTGQRRALLESLNINKKVEFDTPRHLEKLYAKFRDRNLKWAGTSPVAFFRTMLGITASCKYFGRGADVETPGSLEKVSAKFRGHNLNGAGAKP